MTGAQVWCRVFRTEVNSMKHLSFTDILLIILSVVSTAAAVWGAFCAYKSSKSQRQAAADTSRRTS